MRQNNKEVRFKKISLQMLIDALTHIYNSGADYVDIIGIQNDEQDVINIVVKEDYMTDEELEVFRGAGFNDRAAIEVIACITIMTFTNLYNHVHETEIDFPEAPSIDQEHAD